MPARVIEILIASPGDVKEEREAAREIVLDWNRKYTRRHKIVLLHRMWELDAAPQFGLDPQAAVNEQLVETTDILVTGKTEMVAGWCPTAARRGWKRQPPKHRV